MAKRPSSWDGMTAIYMISEKTNAIFGRKADRPDSGLNLLAKSALRPRDFGGVRRAREATFRKNGRVSRPRAAPRSEGKGSARLLQPRARLADSSCADTICKRVVDLDQTDLLSN